MSWPGTRTWTYGELLTAANMNSYLTDPLNYLHSAVAAQIILYGTGMWPSATSGASGVTRVEMATNKNYHGGMSFVNGAQGFAECGVPLPDDYGGGTVLAKFKWFADNADTDSVVWGLAGVASGDNTALDAAFGTAQEVTDANTGQRKKNISAATAAITIAGTPAAGKDVQWRVYRKGSSPDILDTPAVLENVAITYTRA